MSTADTTPLFKESNGLFGGLFAALRIHLSMLFWGMATGLTLPGVLTPFSAGLGLFTWFSFNPLFLALLTTPSRSTRIIASFLFGWGYHAIALIWILSLHPMTWLGLNNGLSLLISILAWQLASLTGALVPAMATAGVCLIERDRKTARLPLCLWPIFWVFGYSLLEHSQISIAWARLELSQIDSSIVQIFASVLMGTGITLAVLYFNLLLTMLYGNDFLKKEFWQGEFRSVIPCNLLILIPLVLHGMHGFIPRELPDSSTTANQSPRTFYRLPPINVLTVQGERGIQAVRGKMLTEKEAFYEALFAYAKPLEAALATIGPKTMAHKAKNLSLAVLPEEGALPGWVDESTPESNPMVRLYQEIADRHNAVVIVGASSLKKADKTQYHNSLLAISPHARTHPVQFYHKTVLVPYGETAPLADLLGRSWLTDLLEATSGIRYDFLYEPGQNEHGQNGSLFEIGKDVTGGERLKISPTICFELASNERAEQIHQENPDILINSSNLGWFHQNSALNAQFLAYGKLRAAETQRPLVLAANTGISAIIAPGGAILKQTTPGKPSVNAVNFGPSLSP
ncbi:MAG: hypothetical protein K2X01_07795 [Cyanobacteria bacterium]|nr:hypothetical protein [Cyanobacteriota bacterium]